jgi:hypothetical protein
MTRRMLFTWACIDSNSKVIVSAMTYSNDHGFERANQGFWQELQWLVWSCITYVVAFNYSTPALVCLGSKLYWFGLRIVTIALPEFYLSIICFELCGLRDCDFISLAVPHHMPPYTLQVFKI